MLQLPQLFLASSRSPASHFPTTEVPRLVAWRKVSRSSWENAALADPTSVLAVVCPEGVSLVLLTTTPVCVPDFGAPVEVGIAAGAASMSGSPHRIVVRAVCGMGRHNGLPIALPETHGAHPFRLHLRLALLLHVSCNLDVANPPRPFYACACLWLALEQLHGVGPTCIGTPSRRMLHIYGGAPLASHGVALQHSVALRHIKAACG